MSAIADATFPHHVLAAALLLGVEDRPDFHDLEVLWVLAAGLHGIHDRDALQVADSCCSISAWSRLYWRTVRSCASPSAFRRAKSIASASVGKRKSASPNS